MSIILLTVYVLAVSGLSNLYIVNGKPAPGYSHSNKNKNDRIFHSGAPMQQFQPLDGDWLKALEGEDFQEVESGRGGSSDTRTESTTASSLGFDFKYLFDKGTHSKTTSNKNNGVKPQVDNHNQSDKHRNHHHNSGIFDQNQQGFGFNDQGFGQGNSQMFNPFSLSFLQAPNFPQAPNFQQAPNFPQAPNFQQAPNFPQAPNFQQARNYRRSYSSRNRGTFPIWGGRSYSNRFGFPSPQFFSRGFGGF